MPLRLVAVSFLNTVPLIELFNSEQDDGVLLTRALPSAIGDILSEEKADVGLLPMFEVFRGRSGGILSRSCIAGTGAVDSVKLFTRGGLEKVTRLRLDRGSRTSVALSRVLLAEIAGVRPELESIRPVPGTSPGDGEGVLVIGDLCFAYEKLLAGDPDVQVHDLGSLWFELTGLPFVFAAWSASPGWPEEAGRELVAHAAQLLDDARDHGLARLGDLAAREAAAGALGPGGDATASSIDYYFRRSLEYKLGDEHLAGIQRFFDLCQKHELIDGACAPEFL